MTSTQSCPCMNVVKVLHNTGGFNDHPHEKGECCSACGFVWGVKDE